LFKNCRGILFSTLKQHAEPLSLSAVDICNEGWMSELDIEMQNTKSILLAGLMTASLAAGAFVATNAAAESHTYVACNRYDECWKVKEKYSRYPTEEGVVFRDNTWYAAHEHDAHVRWMDVPSENDAGYFDRSGDWHAFSDAPAPPPNR
jgi:hypothetical protein